MMDLSDLGHSVLRTELKCLYVGLTRARMQVWIWDTSDKGDAFKVRRLDPGDGLCLSVAV